MGLFVIESVFMASAKKLSLFFVGVRIMSGDSNVKR